MKRMAARMRGGVGGDEPRPDVSKRTELTLGFAVASLGI